MRMGLIRFWNTETGPISRRPGGVFHCRLKRLGPSVRWCYVAEPALTRGPGLRPQKGTAPYKYLRELYELFDTFVRDNMPRFWEQLDDS